MDGDGNSADRLGRGPAARAAAVPVGLRCPACHGRLSDREQRFHCVACGYQSAVDDLGIIRLGARSESWPTPPPSFVQALPSLRSREEVRPALEASLRGWSRPRAATARALTLGLRQASIAALAPARRGQRALLLGGGWGELGGALGFLGAPSVAADFCYERLRLSTLLDPLPGAVLLTGRTDPLPFDDGAFDLVAVDLEQLAHHAETAHGRRRTRRFLLSEIARVLAPGGTALFAARNRFRGQRIPGIVRRALSAAAAPWPAHELRRAGFLPPRILVPWPRRILWDWLVPAETLTWFFDHLRAGTDPARRPPARIRRRLRPWSVLRSSADYYLLASKAAAGSAPRPHYLPESLRPFIETTPPAVQHLFGGRVAFVAETAFVKFPLSAAAEAGLLREVEATRAARASAFGPHVVPWTTLAHRDGIPFAIFPRVRAERSAAPTRVAARLAELLDSLPREGCRLSRTAVWRRLNQPATRATLQEAGFEDLLDDVLDNLAGAATPCGPSHGDLSFQNVLLAEEGGIVIVDWEPGIEMLDPMFIDLVRAAQCYAMLMHPRESPLPLLAAGKLADPLTLRLHASLGDLSIAQAITVWLLHHCAWVHERQGTAAREFTMLLETCRRLRAGQPA